MKLRIATRPDVTAIAALHAASWRNTYKDILSEEFLQNGAEQNRSKYWQSRFSLPAAQSWTLLALDHDQLIGFTSASLDIDPRWGARVDHLHVRHEFKGRGLGRLLISRAAAWVHENRPESPLHLFTYEKNVPAVGFYKKLGADVVERLITEAPDGTQVTRLRCAWMDVPLLIRTAESAGFPDLHSDIGGAPA